MHEIFKKERSRQWVLDLLKSSLPERVREDVFDGTEGSEKNLAMLAEQYLETRNGLIDRVTERIEARGKNTSALSLGVILLSQLEVMIDLASQVPTLSLVANSYCKATKELASENVVYRAKLGLIDQEDLAKKKRQKGLTLIECTKLS